MYYRPFIDTTEKTDFEKFRSLLEKCNISYKEMRCGDVPNNLVGWLGEQMIVFQIVNKEDEFYLELRYRTQPFFDDAQFKLIFLDKE